MLLRVWMFVYFSVWCVVNSGCKWRCNNQTHRVYHYESVSSHNRLMFREFHERNKHRCWSNIVLSQYNYKYIFADNKMMFVKATIAPTFVISNFIGRGNLWAFHTTICQRFLRENVSTSTDGNSAHIEQYTIGSNGSGIRPIGRVAICSWNRTIIALRQETVQEVPT